MPRSLRQRFLALSQNLFGGWNLRFLRSVAYYLLHYRKKLDYWLSLLAAEVYSFITIFVGNLGTISKLYPLVAAFTLSGYYESTPAEILLSVISMALCGTISGILIYRLSKRDALQ